MKNKWSNMMRRVRIYKNKMEKIIMTKRLMIINMNTMMESSRMINTRILRIIKRKFKMTRRENINQSTKMDRKLKGRKNKIFIIKMRMAIRMRQENMRKEMTIRKGSNLMRIR